MSETMRQVIPILFMFGFVGLLAPFMAFVMWMAFDGDGASWTRRSRTKASAGEVPTRTSAATAVRAGEVVHNI